MDHNQSSNSLYTEVTWSHSDRTTNGSDTKYINRLKSSVLSTHIQRFVVTFDLRKIGIPLLLGQLLACLIAVTAICSTFLANNDIDLPLTQNLLHYILLSTCYVPICAYSGIRRCQIREYNPPLSAHSGCISRKVDWCRIGLYIIAGLVDTHANWSIVAAYQYTSVTSVQLLDCLTIPSAMLLSFLFLRYRFRWSHYVAMVICLAGAGGMVAADVLANPASSVNASLPVSVNVTSNHTANVILGDFLVILGAMAYAGSNVLQQHLVVQYGFIDFLAYAGVAALIPTAVYTVIFERHAIWRVVTGASGVSARLIGGCFSGYVASMFLLYSLMPYVLSKTSAVLVNLSLLTADVYALLIGIYLFHNQFHALYVLCFVFILFGVGLFSSQTPLVHSKHLRFFTCLKLPPHVEVTEPVDSEMIESIDVITVI